MHGLLLRQWARKAAFAVTLAVGTLAVLACFLVTVVVLVQGLPSFFGDNAFELAWPHLGVTNGLLALVLTTLYTTVGALVLGSPCALLCALLISRHLPPRAGKVLQSGFGILATVPSVVYGLLGLTLLLPWVERTFHLADGHTLLTTILLLALMLTPHLVVLCTKALSKVPREVELAAISLGATKVEATFAVSLRHARRDIGFALLDGAGRAVGESVAVLMVIGNVMRQPRLLQAGNTLGTAVLSNAGGAIGDLRTALFGDCLLLILFIVVLRLLRLWIAKGGKK